MSSEVLCNKTTSFLTFLNLKETLAIANTFCGNIVDMHKPQREYISLYQP